MKMVLVRGKNEWRAQVVEGLEIRAAETWQSASVS
jgi:hypothetical protein